MKKGILTLVGGSLAIFWPGSFIFGFPGIMAPYWQASLGVGKGAIGNVMFFVLASLGVFMLMVGKVQKTLGARRMVTIGIAICGLDMLLLLWVKRLWVLYLWAFLMGTSSCFIYIPALTVVQGWFPGRRGLVSGIVNLVFGISAAVTAPLFGWMLKSMGYAEMNLLLGLLALIVGFSASRMIESPEGMTSARSPKLPSRSLTLLESLRTPSLWSLWFTWALQGAAGISMVTLSVTFGLSRGLQMGEAVLILTAFNLANGLSRLISGYLSDLLGRNLMMSITFLLAGAAYLCFVQVHLPLFYALLALVVGFAFGTLFSVSAPLVSDCFGLEHFGAILGFIFTAYGFLSGIIGPSLSGYLLDTTGGNFGIVFGYLGAFCFAAGILVLFVRPPRPPKAGIIGKKRQRRAA